MEAGDWVTEAAAGFGTTLQIKKKLCSLKSQFQSIEIYETVKLGRLLMLDGIIQLTSFDEFAYHEMMANVPLFAHGNAKRVLVIGGGDGGVLRELGRHPELEELDICEIDSEVIAAARKFLPETACGFDDPRVRVHIADGSVFVRNRAGYYDVIIVDSTDPGGPGAPLFNQEFYRDLKLALRMGGVIATQSESPFLLPELVTRLNAATRACFRYAGYASIMVPTYPTGMIGMSVGSDGRDVTKPACEVPPELASQLRYYNADMHRAAFARPNFVQDITGGPTFLSK